MKTARPTALDIFDSNGKPLKRIIPDNEYLPFISPFEVLDQMEVGDIVGWPPKKASCVRIIIQRLKKKKGKEFRTHSSAKDGCFNVCRFA